MSAAGGPAEPSPATDGSAPSWPELLERLVAGRDLAADQASWALGEAMSGRAGEARLAALLVGLRAKGESVGEVAGLADAMLAHAVPLPVSGEVLDVVGTGGDGAHTVNLSTMAAVVAAAAGARVVKHGNRAASSRCGTADVLEALGLNLDLPADRVATLLTEVGLTFCFAPRFHPAMRHLAPVRKSLGIRTVVNSLGPLANPARPAAMALGVADAVHVEIIAEVLAQRGTTALVFRSEDGLDELSTTAPSAVRVVLGGEVAETDLDATALGLPRAELAELRGGDAAHNAAVARRVLGGEPGPIADVVALNAAAGLLAAQLAAGAGAGDRDAMAGAAGAAAGSGGAGTGGGEAPAEAGEVAAGLLDVLAAPLDRARQVLASGAAAEKLESWLAAAR